MTNKHETYVFLSLIIVLHMGYKRIRQILFYLEAMQILDLAINVGCLAQGDRVDGAVVTWILEHWPWLPHCHWPDNRDVFFKKTFFASLPRQIRRQFLIWEIFF